MAFSLTSLCEKPAGDVTPHDRWRSVAVSGATCEVSLEPSPPPEPAHTAGHEGQRVSGLDGTGHRVRGPRSQAMSRVGL